MKHPLALDNRQKTLASLLALGVPVADAAKHLGVSKAYVDVLLKGSLFQFEVDAARERLIGERLGEYNRLVSEQLIPNLEALIRMRDNDDLHPSVRLRAIELIAASIVPRAKARDNEVEIRGRFNLPTEKRVEVERTLAEVTPHE